MARNPKHSQTKFEPKLRIPVQMDRRLFEVATDQNSGSTTLPRKAPSNMFPQLKLPPCDQTWQGKFLHWMSSFKSLSRPAFRLSRKQLSQQFAKQLFLGDFPLPGLITGTSNSKHDAFPIKRVPCNPLFRQEHESNQSVYLRMNH